MTLEDFLTHVKSTNAIDLATEFLYRDFVHAIPDESIYKSYLELVRANQQSSEHVAIMGSGNWKFSLNPIKNFSAYSQKSDIDVAIICRASFEQVWDELRDYHRNNFYLLPSNKKDQLKRNGQNVYSGFVSPKWIPGKSLAKFNHNINCNNYSNEIVGHRTVNVMYFKSKDEAVDYYVRGFKLAQRKSPSQTIGNKI
ncbi:conserved hypothetical protein [Candidatus Nitrotoga sp. BS]|uniref:hypothetical protein n=1 Tax=Candidatus Nitrotoga sp. BS TaxID=2890408 RepID=UPI001EF1F279|nr:hypothetical protein [Candidatus Nitrotoga sp. BS]CAH1209770.1 conserved hypothetical protein [Candidatus Nitrotoga sp. BS]